MLEWALAHPNIYFDSFLITDPAQLMYLKIHMGDTRSTQGILSIYNVSLDYLIRGEEYQPNCGDISNDKIVQETLNIFAKKGINKPYILQPEKWSILNPDDIMELSNHFEWVVHKSKSRERRK